MRVNIVVVATASGLLSAKRLSFPLEYEISGLMYISSTISETFFQGLSSYQLLKKDTVVSHLADLAELYTVHCTVSVNVQTAEQGTLSEVSLYKQPVSENR